MVEKANWRRGGCSVTRSPGTHDSALVTLARPRAGRSHGSLGRFSEDFPTEPVWLTSQSTNSLQKGVFLFAQTLITLLVRETTSEGEQMRRCFGWRHALPLLVAVVAVAVIPA